jgi:hypothetical protein
MGGVADLDVLRARHGGARVFQVYGIEDTGAIFALVTAGAVVIAMRTSADDVTIRQEAAIGGRIGLLGGAQFQKTVLPELAGEMKCQLMVLGRGGTAEIVE